MKTICCCSNSTNQKFVIYKKEYKFNWKMIEEHMVKSNINTIYNKHHITYQHVHVAGHRNINIYHFKDNFQGENDFE